MPGWPDSVDAVVHQGDPAKPPTWQPVVAQAPKMPPTFFGKVQFTYRAGEMVLATVEEQLKP